MLYGLVKFDSLNGDKRADTGMREPMQFVDARVLAETLRRYVRSVADVI